MVHKPKVKFPKLLKINDLEEREYQNKVSDVCLKQSTLAVLPTGLGKTIIALRVILERIQIGKILFLAPTKPLAQQHANFFEKYLNLNIEFQGCKSKTDKTFPRRVFFSKYHHR